MHTLEITRPDDWHVHLRDHPFLPDTVKDIARYFGRAIVMPNLLPPVTTVALADAYRNRILACLPESSCFEPLMTLYLTDQTSLDTIREARESAIIQGVKLYPAGATTNSDRGVADIESFYPLFEEMARQDIPLLIHGEVTDPGVDIFDREAVFIDLYLQPLLAQIPELRVVLEHITTEQAAEFVMATDQNLGATITAHHLLYNRNEMLASRMKSLYYCLPILKRERHRQALVRAAISGDKRFFLGTDSAPHTRAAKENALGCAAGIYTAHAGIELYAEIFDQAGALDKLEGFASHHGPDFYGLPRNSDTITLAREAWHVEPERQFGDEMLIPLRGGGTVAWQVNGDPAV